MRPAQSSVLSFPRERYHFESAVDDFVWEWVFGRRTVRRSVGTNMCSFSP